MSEIKNRSRILSAANCLPMSVRNILSSQSDEVISQLREIRLRVDLPIVLCIGGKPKCIGKNGSLEDFGVSSELIICSRQIIEEAFKNICGYSVYAHLQEIVSGFVTMPMGHRAGISGTAVMSEGKIINIRDVSSVCIRIAREVRGIAKDIAADFFCSRGGLLLCGVPASGKTTILRDFARIISSDYRITTSVIDTRNELSATFRGVAQNDLGFSDILVSYPRANGIQQALRSLSPQVIVCDEIGTNEDAEAVLSALNSGVRIVASVHAATPKELRSRSICKEILCTGGFSDVCFLSSPDNPGVVVRRMKVGDVLNV